MRLPPYPKYKNSGVEWIGNVPEHWETSNIRRYALMRTGHTPSRLHPEYWEDCTIPWFTLADVWQLRGGTRKYLGPTKENISHIGLANSAAELLPGGTVVFSRTASIGFSGVMPIPMTTSQDFWNWVCGRKLLSEYLLMIFRAMTNEFDRLVAGSTHQTIYQPVAASISICVPPIAEQKLITEFLDRDTARIDTLIAKKRNLIERLKENRSAIISRTVTRGLPPDAARAAGVDPNPRVKHSGLEWLGEMPEHWTLTPLMHLTDPSRQIMYGIVLPGPDVDDGVPIVKGGDVKPGQLTLGKLCRTTHEIEAGYARSRLKGGDIVFSIRGTVGEAETVPEEIAGANLTQDAARIAVREGTESAWLLFALKARAVVDPLLSLSLGAAVRGVNIRDLKRVRVPLPPQHEQRAIADYLNREMVRIGALAARVETAIERLQEYRSALITAAVTGKIDVRGLTAAPLSADTPSSLAVDIPNTV